MREMLQRIIGAKAKLRDAADRRTRGKARQSEQGQRGQDACLWTTIRRA